MISIIYMLCDDLRAIVISSALISDPNPCDSF